MTNSFKRLIYHGIWLVRNAKPILTPDLTQHVHTAIINEFVATNCSVIHISSHFNHVHCLFENDGQLSMSQVFKQVKGASAYQLNADSLIPGGLYWEKGYDCFTVSPIHKVTLVAFISKQEEIHRKMSLEEEMTDLRRKAGLIR